MMDRAQGPREEAQQEVIDFLADPATHGGQTVERHATHGNFVFLAGDQAFKVKRAVRFDYMDFSTLEKRRRACEHEVELNRRWAPEIYLGCVPIRRCGSGALSLDGSGEAVEWAVRMRRFDQADLLSTRATRGEIDADLATGLAYAVHASHANAVHAERSEGTSAVRDLARSIVDALAASRRFAREQTDGLSAAIDVQLERASDILDERARQGFVRRCHGDLHLANIVLWQGRPVVYDAIEFDDDLATIDTLYDLAFLLMDLECRGLGAAANIVMNRYLWRSGDVLDLQGLAALPLFLVLRAAVRARVSIDRAAQAGSTGDVEAAQAYFEAALRYVRPGAPRLIVVAGLSGTGKTTLAAALAPGIGAVPGAVHLRSDLERKALAGVGELERLPDTAYTPQARRHVYESLHRKARLVLAAGHSVVIDAVYDAVQERDAIEAVARSLGVPFRAVWLSADKQVMMDRVAARERDASDATPRVVEAQAAKEVGALGEGWTRLAAGGPATATRRAAAQLLGISLEA